MNTKIHWSWVIFLLAQSALAAIIFPMAFPNIRLVFFAPLQSFVFMRTSLPFSLWISLISGLFLDCTTSSLPFGTHSILCSIIALLLHGRKKHFFEEKVFSWVIYSALISSLYAVLIFFCILLFEIPLPLSSRSIFSDMVIMAIIDGIYTLVWCKLPMYIIIRIKKLFMGARA